MYSWLSHHALVYDEDDDDDDDDDDVDVDDVDVDDDDDHKVDDLVCLHGQ